MEDDPTQSKNLADSNPEKLRELRSTFTMEASKYNVFPIDNSRTARLDVSTRPSLMRGRNEVTFYKGMIRYVLYVLFIHSPTHLPINQSIIPSAQCIITLQSTHPPTHPPTLPHHSTPEGAAPDTKNKDFNVTADVNLRSDNENGVLATIGGRYSGWAFYLKDGYLKYHYNLADNKRFEVVSNQKVSAGDHKLGYVVALSLSLSSHPANRSSLYPSFQPTHPPIHLLNHSMTFDYDGGAPGSGGLAKVYVDGAEAGQGRIDQTLCCRVSLDETFDVGADTGTPAAPDYEVPNEFMGTLRSVKIGF